MQWRIYYDDRPPFDSSMGPPENAPGWGVQIIVEPHHDVGRQLHSHSDYFVYLDDRWVGVDLVGLIDYLVNILGIVKVGRMIESDTFRSLHQQAIDDSDFPRKSGWLQGEGRR